MSKRVFISATKDHNLHPRYRTLKQAVLAKLSNAGLEPQEFLETGIPANQAWTFDNVDQVMRRCVGAAVFGFPRWELKSTKFINEFNHYEAAVAITYGLPILILAERGVAERGAVSPAGGRAITYIPKDADADWLDSPEFTKRWNSWLKEINERKDVFLGYCSKSAGLASQIQVRLQRHGASVLDWAMDFRAGGTILGEIEHARERCTLGIFLFSEDDPLEGREGAAAPRDNVVFEAGYFMSAKGAPRCLIIRAGKAKMPADVGGTIYLPMAKEDDVNAIETRLFQFLDNNL